MASWDEDEWYDDRDEPAPRRSHKPKRRAEDEPDAPDEPETAPVAVEAELEGSVYRVFDRLWWFRVWNRDHHPGVCVRCDVRARVAVMCIGRTGGEEWIRYTATYEVAPDDANGLTEPTRFAMTPWPVALGVLSRIHTEDGPLGRLDGNTYATIRRHIDWLESLYPEARK